MLKHAKGNLLDMAENGDFDIIVQGCNCFNTMGGGIAKEIRERYPHVAEADATTMRGDYTKLGSWTEEFVFRENNVGNFIVVNAYTQYNMSTGEDVFEYVAFTLILQKLLFCFPDRQFGFPYIGMGLAKGNQQKIISLLEWFSDEVNKKGGTVTLVEFIN